jgi:RNA polymerase sigma factor (sigma-70 family)
MRKRDPVHEQRLQQLLKSTPDECKRQIKVEPPDPDYVSSEVLASLVRLRFERDNGLMDAAAAALHKRVVKGARSRILGRPTWRRIYGNKDTGIIDDAVTYFWEKFLADQQAVCNAEVRFEVFWKNKTDDYMRHLLTEENTRPSLDALANVDDDGRSTPVAEQIEDDGPSPEESAIVSQLAANLSDELLALPKRERNAFQFRCEYGYPWKKVAELLQCSIPTARELVRISVEKLQGVDQ